MHSPDGHPSDRRKASDPGGEAFWSSGFRSPPDPSCQSQWKQFGRQFFAPTAQSIAWWTAREKCGSSNRPSSLARANWRTDARRILIASLVELFYETADNLLAHCNDWMRMHNLAFGEEDDNKCLALAATLDQAINGLLDFAEQMGKALSGADDSSCWSLTLFWNVSVTDQTFPYDGEGKRLRQALCYAMLV